MSKEINRSEQVTAPPKKNSGMKALAKDTVIYGATNIVSKFLNWLLAPFYIRVLADSAEYGIVTNLYAWVSVILVVLTLGLETGLFRYINVAKKPNLVYATCFKILSIAVACFCLVGLIGTPVIANGLGYPAHPEYVAIFVVIVSMDALLSVPFAYLRYKQKPLVFAGYKFLFIILNIAFNLFFLLLCPYLMEQAPHMVDWFYIPDYGVGYIFISNLMATSIETLCMLPIIRPAFKGFDRNLVAPLMKFCYPLILLGVMGNFNRMAGQVLIPYLYDDKAYAMSQLGIYGGCLKIAVVMVMFMQAFRFAYDPFVFSKMKQADAPNAYRVAMNYFVAFTCMIFLGVMYWIDFFKHIVRPDYYEGLIVVPIMMAGEILFGIYYNVSIWYKLSDRTYFGALFSFIGLIVTLLIIIIFTPIYGFVACAWASFICNAVMLTLSIILSRKYYAIPYDFGKIAAIGLLTLIMYFGGMQITPEPVALRIALRTLLWITFTITLLPILNPKLIQKIKIKWLKTR